MPHWTAFIFDLDGVITDTAEFHYQSWKRLADEEGIPFTREDNDQLRGISRRESLLRLLKGRTLPEDQMEAWMARKNDYFHVYLNGFTSANLLPEVADFFNEAKAQGIQLGVASASRNTHEVLSRLGIDSLLDAVGDAYSVVNPKPAPDLFLWVAGRLNSRPAQTVIFEDAEESIDTARAAGMATVGLGPVARLANAHVVYPSLGGVCVTEVVKALERFEQAPP